MSNRKPNASNKNPQFPILDKYFNVSRNLDDSGTNPLGMDSRFEGDWLSMSTSKVFQHLEPTIEEESDEKESIKSNSHSKSHDSSHNNSNMKIITDENNNNIVLQNNVLQNNNSHHMTIEEINTSVNTANTINTVNTNNNTAMSPFKVQGQLMYLNNTTLNGTTFRKSRLTNNNNNSNAYNKRFVDNNNSLDDIDPEDHLMNMRETSTQTILSAASWPEVNIIEGKVNIVAANITNYSAGSASSGNNANASASSSASSSASPNMLGRPPLAPLSPRITQNTNINNNNNNNNNNYPHSSPCQPLDIADLQTEGQQQRQRLQEPEQLEPEEKPFVVPQHLQQQQQQQQKNYSSRYGDGNDSGEEDDAGMWRSVASYGGHDTTVDHTALAGGALTPTSKKRGKQTPGPLFQHSPGLSPISSQREKAKVKAIQKDYNHHGHKSVTNQEIGGIDSIGVRTNKIERGRNRINEEEEVDLSILSTEVEADMDEGSVRSVSSLKGHKSDTHADVDASLSIASMSLVDAETSVLTASSAGTHTEYPQTTTTTADGDKDGYVSSNSVNTSHHSINSSSRNNNLHSKVASYARKYSYLSGSAVGNKDKMNHSRSKGVASSNLHVPYYATSVGPPSAGASSPSSSTTFTSSRSRSRNINSHSSSNNNNIPPMGIQLGWLGAFSRTFPGSGRVSVYGSLMSGSRVNLSFANRLQVHSHHPPPQYPSSHRHHHISRSSSISPTQTSPTTKYWHDRLQQSFLSSYS